MNIARTAGAGPLIVIDTDVVGETRSKPSYSTCMSSSVAIETPDVPTLPWMSGRRSGSRPYSVTESNAVDRRVASLPADSSLNRRLVRKASPSPANIRAGASPWRLNGNTPAVNGNDPGRPSSRRKRTSSPASDVRGRATRGTCVPDSDSRRSGVRNSLPRTTYTSSSPAYCSTVAGQASSA